MKPINDGLNKFIESFRDGSSDRREELRIIITLLKQETRQKTIDEFQKIINNIINLDEIILFNKQKRGLGYTKESVYESIKKLKLSLLEELQEMRK